MPPSPYRTACYLWEWYCGMTELYDHSLPRARFWMPPDARRMSDHYARSCRDIIEQLREGFEISLDLWTKARVDVIREVTCGSHH